MNRLTTAFASSSTNNSSDFSQHTPSGSTNGSPTDSNLHPHTGSFDHGRRMSMNQTSGLQIYDDPRLNRFGSTPETKLNIPPRYDGRRDSSARPGLLRHVSEGGRSGNVTPKGVRDTSLSRSREREKDKGVRAYLGSAKRRERLGAMCKGPEERYAVGGPQSRGTSTGTSPAPSQQSGRTSSPRGRGQGQTLGRGSGGATITEVANLWKGSWAVSKGVNDVDWGCGAYEKKIVTATPSGNFMLFDLTKNRLEKDVAGGQARPMNCIKLCQTPAYGHLLLTGSTEGIAKLWDMRDCEPISKKYYKHSAAVTALAFSPIDPHHFAVGTENGGIKRYDIRMAPRPTGSVWGAHGNKGVMDLKWRAGYEGESLEGGGGGGWMASAGADRTVQIWDMSTIWDKPPIPIHTLHTSYPVRKVSWRPSKPTELAIISMSQPSDSPSSEVLGNDDAQIEIWDVRRHYIPKYALPTVDGIAVDIAWGEDESSLVTAFQNGVMAQLDTRERTLPLDSIPRQVVSWSPDGEIVYGLDRFKAGEIPFDDLKPEYANHWDKIGQRPKSVSDPPYEPLQSIGFTNLPHIDPEEFVYLATHYRVEGDTNDSLCRWNSEVASICGRKDDARVWIFLRSLIEEFTLPPTQENKDGKSTFDEEIFNHPVLSIDRPTSPGNTSPRGESSLSPSHNSRSLRSRASSFVNSLQGEAIPLDRVTGDDDHEESDQIEEMTDYRDGRVISFIPPENEIRRLSEARTSISTVVPNKSTITPITLSSTLPTSQIGITKNGESSRIVHTEPKKGTTYSDYPDPYGITMSASNSTSNSSRITTRDPSPVRPERERGIIQLVPGGSQSRTRHNSNTRPEVDTARAIREKIVGEARRKSSEESGRRTSESALVKKDYGILSGTSTSMNKGKKKEVEKRQEDADGGIGEMEDDVYKKERCRPLMMMWEASLDEGDVQLASTLYILASSIMKFPKQKAERVVHSYIDMLDRAHVSLQSAYIRKYAHILSLEVYAQDTGITHISHCQRCRKSTGSLEDIGDRGKKFWWCKRCKLSARTCVICRQGVKGLWMDCGRCGHGGHQTCIRAYYLTAPLHTLPSSSSGMARIHSQAGSSGLQRTISMQGGVPSSHDSASGFITGPSTGDRDARVEVADEVVKGWNTCPGSCGCKCRSVVIVPVEGEV